MTEALNPALYRRLQRHYGSVKISNAGQAMIHRAVRGNTGDPRLLVFHRGEQYRVCCPFCGDTRHRLYVSHMFGKVDEHGRTMNFLAYCQNEGCLLNDSNRERFLDVLEATGDYLRNAEVKVGRRVPAEAQEVPWPGPCKLLSALPERHKARVYLQERGFDPDMLARRYQVSYCKDSHYFLAAQRIIIPVFAHGKLRGWQARYIGELPWKQRPKIQGLPPKYYSTPGAHFKSQCIYNFDNMKAWETGVLVEGPTDVWRFGLMAGCVFGNYLGPAQQRRLLAVFRKRTLVLLLDPEEFESKSTRATVTELTQRMPRRFCAVKLPAGTDPGSLDRDFVRAFVKDEAARQGVRVTYRKVQE